MDYSISYNKKPHKEDVIDLSKEVLNTISVVLQPFDTKEVYL